MQKINVSCCALVTRASFFALHAYFTILYFLLFLFFFVICTTYECYLLLFLSFCSGYRYVTQSVFAIFYAKFSLFGGSSLNQWISIKLNILMELHDNRVWDFCKRIKSQQSDLAIKIPVCCEIWFSKKNQCNKTMKNEANQQQFFLKIKFHGRLGSL